MKLLLLIVFYAAALSCVSAKADTYKVGFILPLSGGGSSFGYACKNGATLALSESGEEVKKALDVRFEDDANLAKNTVTVFNRWTTNPKLGVIVTSTSGTSKAVSPLADQRRVPLLALASDPAVVAGRNYVVSFWVSPEEEVKLLVKEAKRRGLSRVAVVSGIQDGLLAIKREFQRLRGPEIEVVLDEEYPPEEKDFRPFVTKLEKINDLDAIFVNLYFGQTGIFAKQVRELGVKLPFLNVESFEDPAQVELSNGALEGAWYVQSDDGSDDFVDKYLKAFPGGSLMSAANCYDIVKILMHAFDSGVKSSQLNHYFHNLKNFTGAMGTYSATDDNRFTLPAVIKVVQKEGFSELKAVE